VGIGCPGALRQSVAGVVGVAKGAEDTPGCANGAGRSAIARLCAERPILMPNSDAQFDITAVLMTSGSKKPSDLEGFF
jgi:hypothetical protein